MFYPEDGGGVFLKALVPIQESTYLCIPINILRSSDEIIFVLVKSENCRNLIFLKIILQLNENCVHLLNKNVEIEL